MPAPRKSILRNQRLFPKLVLLFIAAAIVVSAYMVLFPSSQGDGTTPGSFQELQEAVSRVKKNPNRSAYGVFQEVFAKLPPMPDDFAEIDWAMEHSRYPAVYLLGPKYYMQPEFYPLFEKFFYLWTDPDPTHWGVVGYGTYPADYLIYTSPGSNFSVATFFHTSWNVQTWQGVSLVPVYPGVSKLENGTEVIQDPDMARKYFKIAVSPDVLLLGPAYPEFDPTWAYRINFSVTAAPDTPKGVYVVGFDVEAPPQVNASQWELEHGSIYMNAGGSIRINRPQLRVVVTIQ
ncbi:hypothetical protein HY546_03445 [archaeon]|nr:hypothetical protein [archaeon]